MTHLQMFSSFPYISFHTEKLLKKIVIFTFFSESNNSPTIVKKLYNFSRVIRMKI